MRKNAKRPRREAPPAKNENLKVSGRPWQIQLAKARFSEFLDDAKTTDTGTEDNQLFRHAENMSSDDLETLTGFAKMLANKAAQKKKD